MTLVKKRTCMAPFCKKSSEALFAAIFGRFSLFSLWICFKFSEFLADFLGQKPFAGHREPPLASAPSKLRRAQNGEITQLPRSAEKPLAAEQRFGHSAVRFEFPLDTMQFIECTASIRFLRRFWRTKSEFSRDSRLGDRPHRLLLSAVEMLGCQSISNGKGSSSLALG